MDESENQRGEGKHSQQTSHSAPRAHQTECQRTEMPAALSFREYPGLSGRGRDALAYKTQMKDRKCVVGTRKEHCHHFQIHTEASISPGPLRIIVYI